MAPDAFTAHDRLMRPMRSLWMSTPLSVLLACLAAGPAAAEEKPITYEDNVAGILKKHCAACHGDGKQEGGLNLANFAGVMKGAGGGEIVVAGRSGGSRLIEVITAPDDGDRMPPEGERVPADEPDAILAADISPDEKLIAIGCTNRLVKIYSTEDGSLKAKIEKHTDWVTAVAFSPDGKYLATGDRVGNIHLWDVTTGGVILPLSEHKKSVRALSWRSDSGVVASCGEDGTVVWWDVKDGWPVVNKPNAHAGGVLDCKFGPQGELATCGRDGLVRIWSAEGNELKKFSVPDDTPADKRPPAGVALLPTRPALSGDGSIVLAGDTAGRLHAWPTK